MAGRFVPSGAVVIGCKWDLSMESARKPITAVGIRRFTKAASCVCDGRDKHTLYVWPAASCRLHNGADGKGCPSAGYGAAA